MSRSAPLSRPAPLSASPTAPGALSSLPRWRHVLIGDAQSPHLLKWARALAPHVMLHVVSTRGFLPGFDALVPAERRLAIAGERDTAGGNAAILRELPRTARWLKTVRPDVLHAHYLTSHGTLAWLAQRLYGVSGLLVGSAWGSDILVSPWRSAVARWITQQVLRACQLTTSDSAHMAGVMRQLGAADVMVFPFGLEAMPDAPGFKVDHAFFANRGLEPVYVPERVADAFTAIAHEWPDAQLAVARTGPLLESMRERLRTAGMTERVRFTGFLDAETQALEYGRARWYLSLPESDSVAVSVLEAMAHGCIPILSDLPANRELVESGRNGLIVPDGQLPSVADLVPLLARSDEIARSNRDWVRSHALFGPCVERFLERVAAQMPARQT